MAYRYFILDSQNVPLARAMLLSPPHAPVWEFELLDDNLEKVMSHELLRLIAMDDSAPSRQGLLLRGRRNRIAVEPQGDLSEEIRQNLRVQTRIATYIYPINDEWTGRVPAIVHDISSGGVAFFCAKEFAQGDQVEIVMPLSNTPIILKTQVLRSRPTNSEIPLYASKFIDIIEDEGRLVREAAFGIQIKNSRSN